MMSDNRSTTRDTVMFSAPPAPGRPVVRIRALGTPIAQGSKKAFVVGGRARLVESAAGLPAWRSQVEYAALNGLDAAGITGPLDGPLELTVEFRFRMPTSRRAALRRRGVAHRDRAPDLDKLQRAVYDALANAGVLTNDSRIVCVVATKREYVEGWVGADITITELEDM